MIASPYPGLRPFTQEETGIFFGRDRQIDQLLDKLGDAYFIAVVGVSGCGKSSLVKAGLLPALKAGFLAEAGIKWRVATMHPGERPMQNLASALLEQSALGEERAELSDAENLAFLLATLRRGPLGLIEVLEETPLPEKTNLLILVDQFEEIFQQSVKNDINEAIAFVSLLLASAERRSHIFVVITMRSDFLGDCPLFFGLPEAINDSQFLTPRLTRDQCRAAIQGPAAVFGSAIEPRLVNHLLNQMGDDPDQLPVLQHCLMRMWQNALNRDQKKEEEIQPAYATESDQAIEISWQDYEAVGELQNAISQHGQEVIEDINKLGEHVERATEYFFRALVEVVSNRRDMRRAASINQIALETANSKALLKDIAEILRAPRYCFIQVQQGRELTFESKLCISHESLIQKWDRLREWRDQEVDSAENYKHLEKTACLWKNGKAALWSTPDLEVALKWQEEEKLTAEWAKRYGEHFDLAMEFLDTSVQAQEEKRRQEEREIQRKQEERERQIKEEEIQRQKERQRQKELEHAQKLAQEAKARQEAEAKARYETEQRANEAKARQEAEVKARQEAEQRAVEQARATKRLRWLTVGLALMLLIAVGAAWLAIQERNKANEARQEAVKLANVKAILIERLNPALESMIDSVETIPEDQKQVLKKALPDLTDKEKLELLDTLGVEVTEKTSDEMETREKESFENSIVLEDENGQAIHAIDGVYRLKPQQKVHIRIEDIASLFTNPVTFEYSAFTGGMEESTYTAPLDSSIDVVTIKALDVATKRKLAEVTLKIDIID